MLAPVVLFVYSRLPETVRTIEALKKNYLATESQLFIFSDGPKNEMTFQKVMEVRDYIQTINGFKSIECIESRINKGLAESVITGVSTILNHYGKIIVLEDDLVTSRNFLHFMNQGLEYYHDNNAIFSIAGYTPDLPSLNKYNKDYYLGYRASSWGWGTWRDTWEGIDWDVQDYKKFVLNPFKNYRFMKGGSDMPYMLWKQMNGKIDSWAIRWCYQQFKNKQLTVFPAKSKVQNIGFNNTATHTKKSCNFKTSIDEGKKKNFSFESEIEIDKEISKEFRKIFSFYNRLSNKFI